MTLKERLRQLAEALPSPTATVNLSRADLETLLGDAAEPEPLSDLTVEDVAEEVGRARSTVRGWCHDRKLRAYRLNGREWRITRAALWQFQREPCPLAAAARPSSSCQCEIAACDNECRGVHPPRPYR